MTLPVKPINEIEEKSEVSINDKILILDSESEEARLASKDELKGDKGDQGEPGTPGAAATVTVGTTSTLPAGSSATVNNSGTSTDAVLNFGIPKGDKGDQGEPGADGQDGVDGQDGQDGTDGNGITSVTSSKVGKTTTVTMNFDEGDPFSFQVQDGADGQGVGDVVGPSSSTDGHLAVFGGATGKIIKDGGPVPEGNVKSFTLSSTSDLTNAQAAYSWYDDGNVAIIIYNDKEYLFDYATENNAYWSVANEGAYDTVSATGIQRAALQLALSSGSVTAITTLNLSVNDFKVLRTDKNYGTPYSPQYDGSPATKKYVDDGLSAKADTSSLGTAAACNTGTSSGNVPILDSNGKLATTILPGVALTDTFTVSTSSDLTSLSSAEQGDIAIVTTENKTYVLSADPYSTAANWKEILAPTGGVTSVNSQTGAVTLDADDISDSTTTNKFVTATEKSTWSGKQDALTLPATPTQGNLVTWGANNKTLVDGGAIPTGVPSGGNNGDVLTNVSGTPTWQAPTGGVQMSTITVTLTSAGWSSNSQTVSATGVTASNTVIVSPAPANISDYADNGVYCYSQGSGTLTFKCGTVPSGDIVVNVLIFS